MSTVLWDSITHGRSTNYQKKRHVRTLTIFRCSKRLLLSGQYKVILQVLIIHKVKVIFFFNKTLFQRLIRPQLTAISLPVKWNFCSKTYQIWKVWGFLKALAYTSGRLLIFAASSTNKTKIDKNLSNNQIKLEGTILL